MGFEIKNQTKTKIEVFFEIPWQEFEKYYNKAIDRFNSSVALDGFRIGKAPREVIEKKFTESRILEEAAENALQEKYSNFLKEENIEVIGSPNVQVLKLAKNNSFEASIKVEKFPEIKLADYKEVAKSIESKEAEIEDKEVGEALGWVRKSRASFEDLDAGAKKEDMVEISYKSEQIEGEKEFQDRFFLGKGQLVPGFEEQIEGMKAGEEKKFEITFPEDYIKKELAGKPVKFNLKLEKVQKAIFPELNDEFAKSLGQFKGLEDFKNNIKDNLKKEKEEQFKQKRREEILEKVIKKSEIEVPELLLIEEKQRIAHQLEHDVKNQLNINLDEYIKQNFKDEKEFDKKMEEQAITRIKSFLVLKEIGEKEGIEVSDEEVEIVCNQFLSQYRDKKEAEKQIDPEKLKSYYRSVLYNDKVLSKLSDYK